jgi:hypothetical protein
MTLNGKEYKMKKPKVALIFPTHIAKDAFFGWLLPSIALERLAAAIEDVAEVELFDARFEKDQIGRASCRERVS